MMHIPPMDPHGCLQVPEIPFLMIPKAQWMGPHEPSSSVRWLETKARSNPAIGKFQPRRVVVLTCVFQVVFKASLPFSVLFFCVGKSFLVRCSWEKNNQLRVKLAKGTICYFVLAKNLRNKTSVKCIV